MQIRAAEISEILQEQVANFNGAPELKEVGQVKRIHNAAKKLFTSRNLHDFLGTLNSITFFYITVIYCS